MHCTKKLRIGDGDNLNTITVEDVITWDYTHQGCPLPHQEDHGCYITNDNLFINFGFPRDTTPPNNPVMRYSTAGRNYTVESIRLPNNFRPAFCAMFQTDNNWEVHIYESNRKNYVIYDIQSCTLIEQGQRENPITDDELMY